MEKAILLIHKYAFDNNICGDFYFNNTSAVSDTGLTTKQVIDHMVVRGQIAILTTNEGYRPVWRMIAEKLIAGRRAVMNHDYPLGMFTTLEDVAAIFENFPDVAREAFRQIACGYRDFVNLESPEVVRPLDNLKDLIDKANTAKVCGKICGKIEDLIKELPTE